MPIETVPIDYESPEPIDIRIPLSDIQVTQFRYLANRLNPEVVEHPIINKTG
jgi:hypothetical protein